MFSEYKSNELKVFNYLVHINTYQVYLHCDVLISLNIWLVSIGLLVTIEGEVVSGVALIGLLVSPSAAVVGLSVDEVLTEDSAMATVLSEVIDVVSDTVVIVGVVMSEASVVSGVWVDVESPPIPRKFINFCPNDCVSQCVAKIMIIAR